MRLLGVKLAHAGSTFRQRVCCVRTGCPSGKRRQTWGLDVHPGLHDLSARPLRPLPLVAVQRGAGVGAGAL